MSCRTRFAPSPTGFLHIGGARTALYCWLEARHRGGEFLLRIEDTDRERSTQAAIDAILEAMDWLGLDYDGSPVYQTQRLARYREVAEQLVASGHAYYAYESKDELEAIRNAAQAAGGKPRYDGRAREQGLPFRDDPNRVIRFKNPLQGSVVFDDRIKGRIEISNTELDDLVIFRSDGYPTYNFAVVVDDWDMGITDVIRGDDHINNTPRQINIYQALGAQVPKFAHMPMILDPQGAKLSKRTGAADVMQYREAGYLPHALINYLARLGWSHGDQEIFGRDELIALFSVEDVNSKASRLDPAKLGWLNQHYLKTDDPATLAPLLEEQLRMRGVNPGAASEDEGGDVAGPAAIDVVVALRDRVQTMAEMAERALVWYQPLETYDAAAVAKHLTPAAAAPLAQVRQRLAELTPWRVEAVSAALHEVASMLEIGMGKVAQPLRVAMTGTQVSPDIAHTVYLAGRVEALKRIDAALIKVGAA